MSRKRKLLWGVVIGLGVVLLSVIALMVSTRITAANERRAAYDFLEGAASKRFEAVLLSEPAHGMTDCYPPDSTPVSCYAVVYYIGKQDCLEAQELLVDKPAGADCSDMYKTLNVQGERVGVSPGPGANSKYELRLWLESDL